MTRTVSRSTPPRFVAVLARWAIMVGILGTVVTAVVLTNHLRNPESVANQQGLLMFAAILLSMAFVLAPLVRRTFNIQTPARSRHARTRRTLLDELREGDGESASVESESPTETVRPVSRITLRLIVALYCVFTAALLVVLWQMQLGGGVMKVM